MNETKIEYPKRHQDRSDPLKNRQTDLVLSLLLATRRNAPIPVRNYRVPPSVRNNINKKESKEKRKKSKKRPTRHPCSHLMRINLLVEFRVSQSIEFGHHTWLGIKFERVQPFRGRVQDTNELQRSHIS
ncbi:hypothetical protein HZH68_011545 [Vespula germanica]|uniref:Uncharacterized protein n=1 Tax=Vespula germanica TaxID=30212 RepID=A0A834JPQ5_VESGE|nr:hypothetical protein HZH68_011545 [Vespula germanica]